MFGVPNLTEDMVRSAIPFLPESAEKEVQEAESHGRQAWLDAVEKYKSLLCKALGLELPGASFAWRDEFKGLVTSYAKTGKWPELASLIAAGDWENAYAGVAYAPEDFWKYIVERTGADKKLSNLNATLGACTPKLCKLLMEAPKDLPLSLFLVHASAFEVDNVPDVPLSFMDDFPELLDAEDYANAFMKAYIISCLRLFFDPARVDKYVERYTPADLRRYFPRIVWEVSGHSFYDNEAVLFDTVTNW